jgi:hypothetical protein
LNDAHFDLSFETSRLDQVNDEPCHKRRDFVSIQHTKLVPFINVEIHQPVSVAIKAAAPLTGLEMSCQGRRQLLGRLHIVSPT